jgi:hypothetical protein
MKGTTPRSAHRNCPFGGIKHSDCVKELSNDGIDRKLTCAVNGRRSGRLNGLIGPGTHAVFLRRLRSRESNIDRNNKLTNGINHQNCNASENATKENVMNATVNELKGYAVPLTPEGKSSIDPPPPWHYSADCMAVEYWADPTAVAALLPPGLVADPDADGRCFFWFLDWQFTGEHDELTDPARYQYRESLVLIDATFESMKVTYCPYIFVDNDASIARGWIQGFPKRLGSIFQTRSFAAPGPAAAPLAPGSRFGASVAAHGERIATARIQLEEAIVDPTSVFNRPITIRRYFPQLVAGKQHVPAVDELTLSITDNSAIVNLWAGSAELTIPQVPGEDIHQIAPRRVGRGYRLSMSYSVTDLRILKDYRA